MSPIPVNRREWFCVAATGAVGAVGAMGDLSGADEPADSGGIIDTNVTLSRWPFRRLPLDDDQRLVAKLRSLGVRQAWAGSFEGVFHRDTRGANDRLVAVCEKYSELIPFGTIHLGLPDWETEFHRCVEKHRLSGIRLFPGYHDYNLGDSAFTKLLRLAAQSRVVVQVAVSLEDTRTHPSMLQVPDVELTPLADVAGSVPNARIQVINHRMRSPKPGSLAEVRGIHFDTARVDGTDGIPNLVDSLPSGRVMHGTHAPFLIPEAALVRTHESGRLSEEQLTSVLSGNARRFLDWTQE